MKCVEVAVLRGGPSSEYEVSLKTGAAVIASLSNSSLRVRDIIITRAGEWMVDGFVRTPEQALVGIDVVFIALHGQYGEDGTVQRILERLNLPYTGSTPFASALAMNKALTKEQVASLGVKMPRHLKMKRDNVADIRQAAMNIGQLFGPEYVVKPISGGSSVNTVMASGQSELINALGEVLDRVDTVLVEERIHGREATVGILDQYRFDKNYVLPVIEIVPQNGEKFFTLGAKYSGLSEEICPGRFSQVEKEQLQSTALNIHRHLGLRHYSRADFIVAPDGVYFLEVNTLPGLTNESLFPKAMEAVGSTYYELVTHLIKLALRDV